MYRTRHFAVFVALLFAVQVAIASPLPRRSQKPVRAAAEKKKDKEPKSLHERIERIVSQPDLSRGFWGIEAVSLTTGRTIFTHNGDKLFTPASNTKLFTTAAALALIGPDYRFQTTVETNGALDKYGRLTGDVVLVGRGDPNLSGRMLPYASGPQRRQPPMVVLQQLADQLIQKGVRYIDGDVVGDDTYFAFERYADGWSQDDMSRWWGAPVSALTINDNVQFVRVQPGGTPGEKAFISIEPFPDYYQLDNRIMTTPAGTGPRNVNISREPGAKLLTLWGTIPADDPGFNESLAIEDPAEFAARLFRRMLEERGVTVYGRARAKHLELANLSTFTVTATAQSGGGDFPRNAVRTLPSLVLGTYQSQPLAQDLPVVNKDSQNLHAELLLRLLGREKGTAGTIEAGSEVLRGMLSQADIRSDEYVFFDGSGLSRQNLVTPHAIVKLLLYASRQPWGPQFAGTLPLGGVDGTLAERFRSVGQGKVSAKTGSLSHVSTLSGYATTASGDRIAFSVMSNNYNVSSAAAMQAIDQIVTALMDDGKK